MVIVLPNATIFYARNGTSALFLGRGGTADNGSCVEPAVASGSAPSRRARSALPRGPIGHNPPTKWIRARMAWQAIQGHPAHHLCLCKSRPPRPSTTTRGPSAVSCRSRRLSHATRMTGVVGPAARLPFLSSSSSDLMAGGWQGGTSLRRAGPAPGVTLTGHQAPRPKGACRKNPTAKAGHALARRPPICTPMLLTVIPVRHCPEVAHSGIETTRRGRGAPSR